MNGTANPPVDIKVDPLNDHQHTVKVFMGADVLWNNPINVWDSDERFTVASHVVEKGVSWFTAEEVSQGILQAANERQHGAEKQSSDEKHKTFKKLCRLPWRPFPTNILPEPIRSFVDEGSKSIGCDPSYIALPLLVGLGGAIGNTRRLILKRGFAVPPILWGAVIGESGTAKSPAFKLAIKPFRERQARLLKQHADEMKVYDLEYATWERDHAEWKKGKVQGDPPERPEQPKAVRLIVSDITMEAIAPMLLDNPRGLTSNQDELATWICSFDQYRGGRGGDAQRWLSMYDGDSIIVDRKTGTPRTIYVPSAAMSIVGGIQPAILQRALKPEHRESGLAARLLLTNPPRKVPTWRDDEIEPAVEAELVALVDRLYSLEFATNEAGDFLPVTIGLSQDAQTLWRDYYDRHAEELADMTGDMAAAFSKLQSTPARLALILHYVTHHDGRDVVSADTLRRAIALAEWFKHETQRVYGVLDESDDQMELRQLLDWIVRRGGEVTVRDVTRGPRAYRDDPDLAEAHLNQLVATKLGTWSEPSATAKGGRPTRIFRVVTSGDSDETQETHANNEVSSPQGGESDGFVTEPPVSGVPFPWGDV